jgi:hypothetical protein
MRSHTTSEKAASTSKKRRSPLNRRSVVAFVRQCLGVSVLGAISIGTPIYTGKGIGNLAVVAIAARSSDREQYSTAELFSRLTARHHWQEARLVRLSVVRTYRMKNGKGKILAEEAVVMEYTAPRTETFRITSEKGSQFICRHVFQRLMRYEEKRVQANKNPDSLITPENYTLEVVGRDRIGNSDCLVVHAVPRREQTDLFEGKIWIDNQDFAIAKITGHLAKSPSFWIKQVDFVRDYQKVGGFWLLLREQVVSPVRIFGKETLMIDYQDYNVNSL